MSVKTFYKDASEVLDYTIKWTKLLGTDTISTSTWTVPTGLTAGSETNTSTTSTAWISSGTLGTLYTVQAKIVTVGGRTYVRNIKIKIAEK